MYKSNIYTPFYAQKGYVSWTNGTIYKCTHCSVIIIDKVSIINNHDDLIFFLCQYI